MIRFLVLFLTVFLISGCVTLKDPETSQEFRAHEIAAIKPDQPFSQTFVSRRANLTQLQIWLRVPGTDRNPNSKLIFELYRDHTCLELINQQSLTLEDVQASSPLTIAFQPVKNPALQPFCYRLSLQDGEIYVLGRNEDQYPNGEAYLDNNGNGSDSAFRTGYWYDFHAFITDILTWLEKTPLVIPLILTLWLPGRFILYLTRIDQKFDWGERTAFSIGLSLSIISILLTWSSFLRFQWNKEIVWLGYILLIVAFTLVWFRRSSTPLKPSDGNKQHLETADRASDRLFTLKSLSLFINHLKKNIVTIKNIRFIPLFTIFVITLATRLIMVRDLFAPAWVDSVHHALITQLILSNGAHPHTYAPFIDMTTASYHAGFHSSLAVFQWLSGSDLTQGLIFFGQILNATMVFSVYTFTNSIAKNRIAGLFAALVVGVFSPMPAYYTSWGRYTQLAGLVILPIAFSLSLNQVKLITEEHMNLRRLRYYLNFSYLLVAGTLSAGLMLTHYRIFVFLGALWVAFFIVKLIQSLLQKKGAWEYLESIMVVCSPFLVGVFLSIPWWPATFSSLFYPSLSWMNNPAQLPLSGFSWTFLTSSQGTYVLILGLLGFLWAIYQRRIFQWVLLLWVFNLFFLANLSVWGLPGSNLINNLSVTITLFLPLSVLCGFVLGWVLTGWFKLIPANWKALTTSIIVSIIGGVVFLGARSTVSLINPITILFRQADEDGISWVSENIPNGEKILVNPFSWGYGVYAGTDGGYWISPIAETPTIPPAVLYGLDTIRGQSYLTISQKVIEFSNDPSSLYQYLQKQNINYIYIGAKGGVLSPKSLLSSNFYSLVYNKDGVWIFQIKT
jgi:hypothetical protein